MTMHHDDHGDDHEEYEDDLACQHKTAKVVAMFWSSYPCRLQNSQINFRIKCPDTGSTFPLNKPFLSPHDTNWKKGQRSGGHLIQGCVKTRSNVWYVLTQELLLEMRLHICQQPSGLWFTSYKMEKLGTHCRFTAADIRRHWVASWCKKKMETEKSATDRTMEDLLTMGAKWMVHLIPSKPFTGWQELSWAIWMDYRHEEGAVEHLWGLWKVP